MLNFILQFFNNLEENGIRYVHWKSNMNLHKALMGEDDLDILVHPEDKEELLNLFQEMQILRGYSEKDSWQDSVVHYFGLDVDSGKVVHIHLHFALPVGFDYNKNYVLPLVDLIMNNRIQLHNVYIPTPEMEYIILVFRILIKNALTPFLLSSPFTQLRLLKGHKIVKGNALKEYNHLQTKIDREYLQSLIENHFSSINWSFFETCEHVIVQNNSLKRFLILSSQLKKRLKPFQAQNELSSFLVSFLRLNKNRLINLKNKLVKNSIKGSKLPEHGGRLIAFVGGDGAGKSTNIAQLKKSLSKHFKTTSIHIGKPPKSWIGFFLYYFARMLRILKAKQLSHVLMHIRLAIDRKKAFKKAIKLRNEGVVVILDRMPTEEISAMDSPRVNVNKYPRLSKFERRKYRSIKGVDLLFALKLNPEIALQRRPKDNKETLRVRSGQVWEAKWDKLYQKVINTGENTIESVKKEILSEVWKNLNTKYKRIELIGISGSGKSTAINKLLIQYNNSSSTFSPREFPLKYIKIICLNIKGFYSRIFPNNNNLKDRIIFNMEYQNNVIRFLMENNSIYSKHLFLDQNIIFSNVIAYKEGLLKKEDIVSNLNRIASFFDYIIYLEAPMDILFQRIHTRINIGTGRAKDMSFDEFEKFHQEYQKAFNVLYETQLKIIKISTTQYCPEEIIKMITVNSFAK